MKITNPYYYTIDEMKQIIAEWDAMGQIINEYKILECIEDITEEEFIYLFGESTLYPNVYFAGPGEGYDYAYVSDYEWHLLESGFNLFAGVYFDFNEWPDYHIIEEFETINPADVAQDICWTDANLTFEQALEEASILDRFHLIIDKNHNIIGGGLFERCDNINEYSNTYFNSIDQPEDSFNLDFIDEVEWQAELNQEIEVALWADEVSAHWDDIVLPAKYYVNEYPVRWIDELPQE